MAYDYDRDHFMKYFQPIDSDETIPTVTKRDLMDFESDAEREGLELVHTLKLVLGGLTVRQLVKAMADHPYFPFFAEEGDLIAPYVDSSVIPPVQKPGGRVYRPRLEKHESWGGV